MQNALPVFRSQTQYLAPSTVSTQREFCHCIRCLQHCRKAVNFFPAPRNPVFPPPSSVCIRIPSGKCFIGLLDSCPVLLPDTEYQQGPISSCRQFGFECIPASDSLRDYYYSRYVICCSCVLVMHEHHGDPVLSQTSPCGIYGGQSNPGAGFSQSTFASVIIIFPILHIYIYLPASKILVLIALLNNTYVHTQINTYIYAYIQICICRYIFIHSFIHLFIHSLICSFIRSFVHSFVH
jgi:hypothetical protein